jgi:hypothetical protein
MSLTETINTSIRLFQSEIERLNREIDKCDFEITTINYKNSEYVVKCRKTILEYYGHISNLEAIKHIKYEEQREVFILDV